MNISNAEAEKMLQIAGGFYDAAAQIVPWHEAIDKLNQLFEFDGIILEQYDLERGDLLEFESEGLPQQGLNDWVEYYHTICPRAKFLRRNPAGTIGFDMRVLDAAEIKRHPLYQDFLRPYGLQYFLSATLEHDAERHTTVSMQRSARQGHASDRDIQFLRLLTKPLQHAFRLKRRLLLNQQKLVDYEAAFHELDTGIVIVDAKSRVEFINSCADSIVCRGDQVSIRNGYFNLVSRRANRMYRDALARLSIDSSYDSHDYACLSQSSTDPLPLRIDILSLPQEANFSLDLRKHQSIDRRLLIMLSDPNRQKAPPEKLLAAFFGLTDKESQLAVAIGCGTKLNVYAEQHKVALSTVRTHLANMRQKMGARDQADVVRLLSRIVQPLLD